MNVVISREEYEQLKNEIATLRAQLAESKQTAQVHLSAFSMLLDRVKYLKQQNSLVEHSSK